MLTIVTRVYIFLSNLISLYLLLLQGASSFHQSEVYESLRRRSSRINSPQRSGFEDENHYVPEDISYLTCKPTMTDFADHVSSNLDRGHRRISETCDQYSQPRACDLGHHSSSWTNDYDFKREFPDLDSQSSSSIHGIALSTNHHIDQNLEIDMPEYPSSFSNDLDSSFRSSASPRNSTNSYGRFSSKNSRLDSDMKTDPLLTYKGNYLSSDYVSSHPTHDLDLLSTGVTEKHLETSAYPHEYNSTVGQMLMDRNHPRELDDESSSENADYAGYVFRHSPVAADHQVSTSFIMPNERGCTIPSASFGSYVSESADCKSRARHSTAFKGNRVSPRESIMSRLGPLVDDVPNANYFDGYHGIDSKVSLSHADLRPDWESTSSPDNSPILLDHRQNYSRNECASGDVLARLSPRPDLRWELDLNHPLEQSLANQNENVEKLRKTIHETRVNFPNVSDALPQIGPTYSTSKMLNSVPFQLKSESDDTNRSSSISNSYSMSLNERSHAAGRRVLPKHPYSSKRSGVLSQQAFPSDEYLISSQSSCHRNFDPDHSAQSLSVHEPGLSKAYGKVSEAPQAAKYPQCALIDEFSSLNEESRVENTCIETFPSHSAYVSEKDRFKKEEKVQDDTTAPANECDYSKVASCTFEPLKSPVCNVSTVLPFSNFLDQTNSNPPEIFQGDSATSSLSSCPPSEFEKMVTCNTDIKRVTDAEIEYPRTSLEDPPITFPTICSRDQVELSDDASNVVDTSNVTKPCTLKSDTSIISPVNYHGTNTSIANSISVDIQVPTAQSLGETSVSASGTKGESHLSYRKMETLARLVVGEELSMHLSQFATSSNGLFRLLFGGCVSVINCLAWKRDGLSLTPQVTSFLKRHLQGFYSATLKQNGIPANCNILYTKELSHLRSLCGNNVLKWNECIRMFVLLVSMIPATPEQFVLEQSQLPKGVSENRTESEIEIGSSNAKVNKTVVSPPCKGNNNLMELPVDLRPENKPDRAYLLDTLVIGNDYHQLESVGYGSKEGRPKSVNLRKDACPEEGSHTKAPEKGIIGTSSTSSSYHSPFQSPAHSKMSPDPIVITSTIPVCSPQKTAQGLQSLLDIVKKSNMNVSIPDPSACKEDKAATENPAYLNKSNAAQSVSLRGGSCIKTPVSPSRMSRFEGQQESSDKNDSMAVISPGVNSDSTISSNLALQSVDSQNKFETEKLQDSMAGAHIKEERGNPQMYSSCSTTSAPSTTTLVEVASKSEGDKGNTSGSKVYPQSVPAPEYYDSRVAFVGAVKDGKERQVVVTKPGHSPSPGGQTDDISQPVVMDGQSNKFDNRNGSLSPGEIRSPSPTLKACSDKTGNTSPLHYSSMSKPSERLEQSLKHSSLRKFPTHSCHRNQHIRSDHSRLSRESTSNDRYGYHHRSEHYSRHSKQHRSRSPPRTRSSGRDSQFNKLRSSSTRNYNTSRTTHSKSRGGRASPGASYRRSRDGERSRLRSCSEDELELLELKKKVIMSMIENDKESGASSKVSVTSPVKVASG